MHTPQAAEEEAARLLTTRHALQTERSQLQGGWLGSLGHIWMLNDQATLQTQVFLTHSYIKNHSVLWQECDQFDERGWCEDDWGESWRANDPGGRCRAQSE